MPIDDAEIQRLTHAGRVEEAVGRLREAREAARAAARQPELLRAYADLGRWQLVWGHLDDAESSFRTAIQQARTGDDALDLGRALVGLARTLVGAGRKDRALLHYTEAIPLLAGPDETLHGEAMAELAALRQVPGGAR